MSEETIEVIEEALHFYKEHIPTAEEQVNRALDEIGEIIFE